MKSKYNKIIKLAWDDFLVSVNKTKKLVDNGVLPYWIYNKWWKGAYYEKIVKVINENQHLLDENK